MLISEHSDRLIFRFLSFCLNRELSLLKEARQLCREVSCLMSFCHLTPLVAHRRKERLPES